jgi:diaminopimelate decarboxylase
MFTKEVVSRFSQHPTPFYYYDMGLLQQTLQIAKSAANQYGFHVHYALKANNNPNILSAIQQAGFGADCVSGGEVDLAIASGFDASKVVFAGVGKSDAEITQALLHGIFAFNVESRQELEVLNELAERAGKVAQVALRINPNVDAQTHHYITTGLDENKFGIMQWELPECIQLLKKCPYVRLIGIHFHVGSQITDMQVFRSLCVKVNEVNNWFDERGIRLQVLNVGGGLGVDYHAPDQSSIADFQSYFDVFHQFLDVKKGQEVHFELGRALVAPSGSLISRVLFVKNGIKKNFLILDAGMTELMRPALYQAYHQVDRLSAATSDETMKYDVVGPICESTDCFGKDITLPLAKRGDLFAIRTAGAYGEVMSSRYNLRPALSSVYSDEIER